MNFILSIIFRDAMVKSKTGINALKVSRPYKALIILDLLCLYSKTPTLR